MDCRENCLVLVIGILFLIGHSLAEDGWPECHPCPSSDQHVQCPAGTDGACPPSYRVAGSPPAGDCPATSVAPSATTTASGAASSGTTGGGGNSSSGGLNSSSSSSTTTPPTTVAATTSPTAANQNLTLGFSNATTDGDNITTTVGSTTAPTDANSTAVCRICLENCGRCDGGRCLGCREGHQLRNAEGGRVQCLKETEEDSGIGIAVIAGASAGGGALLLVVVVAVACVCCRRRRRRRRDQEHGGSGGMMTIMGNVSASPAPQDNPDKMEDVQRRPPKPGVEVPEYVNVTSTMPRPISIERGHDKVTRYVRDPTVKKPEPSAALPGDEEEQELAELPAAPAPPPGPRKRSTDVGDPRAHHHHHDHHPPPSRTRTAPATAADADSASDRWGRHHGASTLPGPSAAPSSDLRVPKFPMEEEMERQEREASGGTAPRARARAADEGDLEEPEKDYENVGSKARLLEPGGGASREASGGVRNPGMDRGEGGEGGEGEEEDPEDDYVNQAAIDEASEGHVYQNVPQSGAR